MQKNLYRLESDHLLRGFCMTAFFLAALLSSPADAANCTIRQGAVVKQLAFQIPSSFTVPRDAPIGT
ncbi:type 1 fimbrial protein, partial [Salmonella enterica]|nr:type 1 fimbrial protein [Salmonella enterica]